MTPNGSQDSWRLEESVSFQGEFVFITKEDHNGCRTSGYSIACSQQSDKCRDKIQLQGMIKK